MKRFWTGDEDARLQMAVAAHGKVWRLVAEDVMSRDAKQCRERWTMQLNKGTDVRQKRQKEPLRNARQRQLFALDGKEDDQNGWSARDDDVLNFMEDGLSIFKDWIDAEDTSVSQDKQPTKQPTIRFKVTKKRIDKPTSSPILSTVIRSCASSTTTPRQLSPTSARKTNMSLVASTEDGKMHIYRSRGNFTF